MTEERYQSLTSSDEDIRLQTIIEIGQPRTSEEIALFTDMLSDKSWRVRKSVVRALAQVDVQMIVPLLIQALSNGNTKLQNIRFHNAAIECLTIIGQPAIPALKIALQDHEKNVRLAAANVLGAIHHYDACDALIEALQDHEINVRYVAIEALAKIPSQKSVIPLTDILESDDDWLKLPAISALGNIGDYRATPYLIQIAQQPLCLQTAIEALGNIGDERGIPCILDALQASDKEIRKTAVLSMQHITQKLDKFHAMIEQPSTYHQTFKSACTEEMMHSLIELTDDKDFTLALAAIKLLGWSGQQEAAYILLEKLGNDQLVETIAEALIYIGANAILPLSDSYEQTRSLEKQCLILECLREIGGEHVLELLLKYLEDSDEEFLTHAILKSLSSPTCISILLADKTCQPSRYIQPLIAHMPQYLTSPHPLVRAEAIGLWGQIRGDEVFDDLMNATKDADPTVRMKAIPYLGYFAQKNPDLLQHLISFLSDDHPNIRKQAALALGNTEYPDAFSALLLVLDESNALVRRAAVSSIGKLLVRCSTPHSQQQALEKLTDVLENRCRRYEDGLLKIEICQTLQYILVERSKDLLRELSNDVDFDVRKAAILAFANFPAYVAELTPILLAFTEDAHWSVREAAVKTIGLLHIRDAETKLLSMLEDVDLTVRKALIIALGQIDSLQSIPILVTYLAHDESDSAAYQGLTLLTAQHSDLILTHLCNENPKINVFLKHILNNQDSHTGDAK